MWTSSAAYRFSFSDTRRNLTRKHSLKIDMKIPGYCFVRYCFVHLNSAEAATTAARHLNGELFLDRPLRITPYDKKRNRSQPFRNEGVIFDRSNNSPGRGQIDTDHPPPTREKRTLYVAGLPEPFDNATSEAEIRELFKEFQVVKVSTLKSPRVYVKGRNSFYAFVDFASAEAAEEARALDGTEAFGGRLKIRLSTSGPPRDLEASAEREQVARYGSDERKGGVDFLNQSWWK